MTGNRKHPLLVVLLLLLAGTSLRADGVPPWLPRYEGTIDLDTAGRRARVLLRATWTNPQPTPTRQLVFNAHAHYVVPRGDVGLAAKTLELLRMDPTDTLGVKEPACAVNKVTLADPPAPGAAQDLDFRFEGDTKTALVVPLPRPVAPGESVSVVLDLTMRLPPKQGRWGQWREVTYLSNWLPVFAYYGPVQPAEAGTPTPGSWQPTPFVPWHQPFFNEAGHYHFRVTLPGDQQVACTGSVVRRAPLPDGRQELEVRAAGVRDFALLASARYRVFEGTTLGGPGLPAVRVRVLAFAEHEYYAREMVRIAGQALTRYSRWFGPYPYPEFTIAEAFFGWNGNECSALVMIDERIFGMPHLAGGYVDYLVSHETCHQWWYNVVGTNGYAETWMDEALATFFSHRLLDEKVGKNNKLMTYPRGLEWLPNIRREDYRSYGLYGTIRRGENGPAVQEMTRFGHVVNLFSMCYDKGARIVGMIEDRLGEAAFFDFMRLVYTRYRYRILRVRDFQRELEAYTGRSWEPFFREWLYGSGLCDWCVAKVKVQAPPKCVHSDCGSRIADRGFTDNPQSAGGYRVTVLLRQKAEYTEQTCLGFALPGREGYPVRIPILPSPGGCYELRDPPARVETLDENRVRVEVLLPEGPTQIAVDPDQVLVDKDPANNFWKPPIRWRFTPVYTFLEETDMTNAYDRWNVIWGPWLYGTAYYDAWYTRSTMVGVRAGAYRTQEFSGGVYGAYRTDYRDVLAGVDGLWDHWPDSRFQTGFNAEKRLAEFYHGNDHAFRAVGFGRYVFKYGSSLYLPPMEYLEGFTAYQDNFLPFDANPAIRGVRYDRMATAGLHYRRNYLTPYWNPAGGFQYDVWYEGGVATHPETVGMHKLSSQLSVVESLPDLSAGVDAVPGLGQAVGPALRWLGETRLALRAYGATSVPTKGEFFTMGGGMLFRGFDLAQRQGSTVWVGSVEWRVPLATNLSADFCDHIFGLRNVWGAAFYDVGDAYTLSHSVGPVAHGVGAGLRLDVAWFGFVERTLLRLDVAKALNVDTGVQVWFGVQHPF